MEAYNFLTLNVKNQRITGVWTTIISYASVESGDQFMVHNPIPAGRAFLIQQIPPTLPPNCFL